MNFAGTKTVAVGNPYSCSWFSEGLDEEPGSEDAAARRLNSCDT